MLSTKVLVGLTLALAALALAAPLHLLFLARYPLVIFQGHWSLSGVRVNATDLVLGFLVLAYILRGRRAAETGHGRLPYLLPWLVLGLLLTASYLNAPEAREHFTAMHRVGYQLYRYAWKGILFFPLCLLLLDSRDKLKRALFAVVLAGDLLAVQGTIQGYTGSARAAGPFDTANELAGALVMPLLLSLIGVLAPQTRFRPFWLLSTMLIIRAMLFTGSRAGILAATAGICFCSVWLLTRRTGRARFVRLAPVALIGGALLFLIKPDLMTRPTIKRALSAQEGLSSQTMQWRIRHRWPVFTEMVQERPWLGTGTAVERGLLDRGGGATPHNGYLALAVAHGIPATLIYLLMALLALRNSLHLFRRSKDPLESLLGLVLASALAGLLVHNIAEATLRSDFVRDIFWLICALSARQVLLLEAEPRKAVRGASARTSLPRVAQLPTPLS